MKHAPATTGSTWSGGDCPIAVADSPPLSGYSPTAVGRIANNFQKAGGPCRRFAVQRLDHFQDPKIPKTKLQHRAPPCLRQTGGGGCKGLRLDLTRGILADTCCLGPSDRHTIWCTSGGGGGGGTVCRAIQDRPHIIHPLAAASTPCNLFGRGTGIVARVLLNQVGGGGEEVI